MLSVIRAYYKEVLSKGPLNQEIFRLTTKEEFDEKFNEIIEKARNGPLLNSSSSLKSVEDLNTFFSVEQ